MDRSICSSEEMAPVSSPSPVDAAFLADSHLSDVKNASGYSQLPTAVSSWLYRARARGHVALASTCQYNYRYVVASFPLPYNPGLLINSYAAKLALTRSFRYAESMAWHALRMRKGDKAGLMHSLHHTEL